MTQPAVIVSKVKLTPLAPAPFGGLSEDVIRTCNFCAKEVNASSYVERINQRLGGKKEDFYCSFCLRNNLHTRNSRHILVISFRSIIGYYYYEHYMNSHMSTNRRIWLAEIEDFIQIHAKVGLSNPVFSYDSETLLWLVDFSKVGTSKKKIKVEEVLKTVVNVLATFNLAEQIPGIHAYRLFEKYKDAIMEFYNQRYRPEGKKMLIPTLVGCIGGDNRLNVILEKTRNFISANMVPR